MADVHYSLMQGIGRFRRVATARSAERLIGQSGLFDPEWYLRTNPDVEAAGVSPGRHYLVHGYREGRDPGPLFDARWYLAQNPDVARTGANPLVHFLRSDPGEGRRARSRTVPAPAGRENLVVERGVEIRPPGRIAVMVHAYYVEVFDEICLALRAIPFPFTLLVSVPDEGGRAAVRRSIERHLDGRAVAPEVRLSPNRGRNFGPFVAEFGREIVDHDYVLHLHTKRSLFTGSDQAHFRDHLVSSLVGSRAVVTAILQLLSQGAPGPRGDGPGAGEVSGEGEGPGAGEGRDVGLVYPRTVATMPHWAHHWLGNTHLAPGLFHRLGNARPAVGTYVDYPVGGMFWARVDAVRPLFDAGFTFEDFPPEEGQNDGTLAHAIERCFVPLAESRGYGFVEVDRESGAFRLNWGSKNLDQYRRLSPEGLHQAIADADVVSFDLFDTVLTRRSVRPDSILKLAGRRLERLEPAATDFFDLRRQAERDARARRGWEGDVSLPEIYEELPRIGPWNDKLAARAMAMELEDDLAASVPRARMVDALRLARSSGKRVLVVSDTYFERDHIERLLEQAGVRDCVDELYLSSEQRARKDRGELWDVVLDREGAPPDRWLHVGDNERSDLQTATDRGIRTYHCMNPTTLLELRGFDCMSAAAPGTWGTDLLLGPVTATLANEPFVSGDDFDPVDIADAGDLGYTVLGPVAMAFLTWLAQHPALAETDHLYFLARDGFLLRRLWERARAAGADRLPSSTYLLVSRRATLAATQALAFDPDRILEGFGFDGTVAELLASRVGLELPSWCRQADLPVTLPGNEAAARRALAALEDVIVSHGAGERADLVTYLERVGLASAGAVAVVDIGYSGTIQRNLQALVGRGLTGFYLGTFTKADEVRETGGTAYGCFAQDVAEWSAESPFHHCSILLEALLAARHGQVERVDVRGDDVVHRFRPEYRTPEEQAVVEQLHAGATRYCDDLLDTYGPEVLDVPVDPAACIDLVKMVATGRLRASTVTPLLVVDDDHCGYPRRVVMADGTLVC